MVAIKKLGRVLRGEVKLTTAAREALRRSRAAIRSRSERASLTKEQPLLLAAPFSRMTRAELLAHFQGERPTRFFEEFDSCPETLSRANRIVGDHCWPLLGFGEKCFGAEVEWRRDPLSGYVWPLDYHRDLKLMRAGGSDVRVLWELNRLGHLLTLGRAYTLTNEERFTAEFLAQLRSWNQQNPYARGANWSCAMEVALRAMNLLAAFDSFRRSPQFDADSLFGFLLLLQQHGNFIKQNLEFSYIATSNHYLSDVAGLLWLGVLAPELRAAAAWREFGLRELLREMDKQVLADGADFESSTGYHRLALELFLYSFMLCRANQIEIPARYWTTLKQMLLYVRAYLRPDGLAPLIGDTDSGQVLPVWPRRAGEHGYLLKIGAAVCNDPELERVELETSKAFPEAGLYFMRQKDCYLCFNASGTGINGHGSHGHNDALSIEVAVGRQAFIVDPGTYVYSHDLQQRHLFRSTAYHSTVKIDGVEQNSIDVNLPFVIGNEASPRVLEWQAGESEDRIVAEHYGYRRLRAPVTHRRTIVFDKRECSWLIEDEFLGEGEYEFEARFHFAPGLEVSGRGAEVEARAGDLRLLVRSLSIEREPVLESQPVSSDYGERSDAVAACWRVAGRVSKLSWKIETRRGAGRG